VSLGPNDLIAILIAALIWWRASNVDHFRTVIIW